MKISDLKGEVKRVSAQANAQQQVTPQKSGGLLRALGNFAGNAVSSVAQPLASLAAIPVQAGARAFGVPDPFAEGIPGLGDKNIAISPLTLKQKAGDVLKAGSEIAAVATAPASIPAAIATGAGIGAAQGAGSALQEDASAQEVLKRGGVGAAIGGATAGVFGVVGKLLGKIGDKIQMSVIRPTKVDIEDGFSINTIKEHNLGGSLNKVLEKTQAEMNKLSTELGEKLSSANTKVDLDDVVNQTIKELTDSSKLKGFGANTKIQNVLEQLKQEVAITGNQLTVPEAQIVKQASGSFGAWQYGKPDPDSKAVEIVYNTFYNKLKKSIEAGSPEGVREINAQLSKLIPVMNAVIRRLPVAERNNLISLSDMIGLVASSANPIALGPTLLNILSKSGNAANLLSKFGPKFAKVGVPASFIAPQAVQAIDTPQ